MTDSLLHAMSWQKRAQLPVGEGDESRHYTQPTKQFPLNTGREETRALVD